MPKLELLVRQRASAFASLGLCSPAVRQAVGASWREVGSLQMPPTNHPATPPRAVGPLWSSWAAGAGQGLQLLCKVIPPLCRSLPSSPQDKEQERGPCTKASWTDFSACSSA